MKKLKIATLIINSLAIIINLLIQESIGLFINNILIISNGFIAGFILCSLLGGDNKNEMDRGTAERISEQK
jgi:hypothetical protein